MNQEIVNTIKERYSRDLRKGVVKNILQHEKNDDKEAQEASYKMIDQIFSYIISELSWRLSENSNAWDDTPLKIISEAFPKIETTKWFKDKQLVIEPKK
ncbi:hypothetical protein [Sulfurimonas sp.]